MGGSILTFRTKWHRVAKGFGAVKPAHWVLALALVLAAGCVDGQAGARPTRPTVVFIGDSITDIATPPIHTLMDPRYRVDVLAADGMRINQRLSALRSAETHHPDAVVVNLGTNDALQGGAHYPWTKSWQELIAMTKDTPCVVLTTVNLASDVYGHKPIASQINAKIRNLAAVNPAKYKVADWNGFLQAHRRSDWRTYLRAELIHPTPAGGMEIASLDRSALATCTA